MALKPDKSLLTLGKYMSLALTLPASVFAGYFLSKLVGRWIHSPLIPILGIILGMAAGLMQIFRELNKETKPKQ
jgi:F0F1-type ATP synthase assembly protein I